MKNLYLLLFTFFAIDKVSAAIYYAAPNATGNGLSWTTPGDLQSLIDNAAPNDEIWAMAGTYYPGTTRDASFSMKNGVSIYGSFYGTETQLSERYLGSGLSSILSGDIGVANQTDDNCYHVIHNTNLDNTAVLDGFIITGAMDERSPTLSEGLGGGMFNQGSGAGNHCNPTISRCIFTYNYAAYGGGMFNDGYNGGEASPLIISCVFASNFAEGGGGMDNFGLLNGNANPTLYNCVFYGNLAADDAGAMYCWGGNDGNASPQLINCNFILNQAENGGALVCDNLNASTGSSGNSDIVAKNCIFDENDASVAHQFLLKGTGTFTATYSIIDTLGQNSNGISGLGTGNLFEDPELLDIFTPRGIDDTWLTADDGLMPTDQNSLCVNAGNDVGVQAVDILGNQRNFAGMVDVGAYELTWLGMNSLETAQEICLFPNPTTSILELTVKEDLSYSIYSLEGKKVSTGKSEGKKINVSSLNQGLYFVHLGALIVPFTKQ